MVSYTVHGTRNGGDFSAPVEADTEDQAERKFLEQVEDESEFTVTNVTLG